MTSQRAVSKFPCLNPRVVIIKSDFTRLLEPTLKLIYSNSQLLAEIEALGAFLLHPDQVWQLECYIQQAGLALHVHHRAQSLFQFWQMGDRKSTRLNFSHYCA